MNNREPDKFPERIKRSNNGGIGPDEFSDDKFGGPDWYKNPPNLYPEAVPQTTEDTNPNPPQSPPDNKDNQQ